MLFQLPNKNQKESEPLSHMLKAGEVITSQDEYLSRLIDSWEIPRIDAPAHPAFHFWTTSRFALHDLVIRLLVITGPANVIISSYSFSAAAANLISKCADKHYFISLKLVLNINRATSLQMQRAIHSLPPGIAIAYANIHAKSAVIWNENYHLSVIFTANASNSNTIERGIVSTDLETFRFDYNELTRIHTSGA